jgi:hypothetical protein
MVLLTIKTRPEKTVMNPQSMTPEQRDAARYKGGFGAIACRPKGVAAVAYVTTFKRHDGGSRVCVVAYAGKAVKPSAHFSFKNFDAAGAWVAKWSAELKARADSKRAEREARKAFKHTLEVGHVLESMWGYDQTNVDYYEVTKLVGDTMVEIRKISGIRRETGNMEGVSVPASGNYVGEPMVKRVIRGNAVRIASYAIASLWDGRPSRWSSYA